MIGRLSRALLGRRGHDQIDELSHVLEAFGRQAASLEARVGALTAHIERLGAAEARRSEADDRIEAMLRFVADEDADNRRRLHTLRASASYGAAFDDPDPLVSITIATRDRPDMLLRRALPSLLGQTHRNIEVVIVGDAAGPDVGRTLATVGDTRVRYANLTQRTVAHPDPDRHHLVGSTIPRNEASRLARGSWLMHFDDDDLLRPDAVASLLELARASRAEVVYGGFTMHRADMPETTLMAFPPELGKFGWQGAIAHGGLRFFERELIAAYYGIPGDTYLMQRMLRVGVRFGLLERIIWDYYPSTFQ